ncbi:NAD(P)-dependent oxidoreductase [Devosia nitrariae]|uniref:2-hydroxyacid dehydrogenase n=1 Tax=Devosia nitrariae TaxID=2071872 RepID=A0ABQ5W2U3_9HYPH|nr:NAD(P)-dependent oxidoreductase [Devosia nitrariae]GLQ54053.1 2-hydroxyacid dehydrogenase [Devosia nitrariae]
MAATGRRVIVAPYPRTMREILAEEDLERLGGFAEIVWGRDEELPAERLNAALSDAWALVGFAPALSGADIDRASELKAVVEVGGHFPPAIDYEACFARGIRVLSCAPAFARPVAEMALAMTLTSCRGLVAAHLDFRASREEWQGDRRGDFSLYGAELGFVGFGSIARELATLLRPFGCRIRVFDPWLTDSVITAAGCVPASLEEVMAECRAIYVLASPTPENKGLISRQLIASVQQDALLVVISRAHLVDFDALVEAADSGRIQAAVDVFPVEPVPRDATVRGSANMVLSPHRAASIRRERQAIGRMAVDDLELMSRGLPPLVLQAAQPEAIRKRILPKADAPAPPSGSNSRRRHRDRTG